MAILIEYLETRDSCTSNPKVIHELNILKEKYSIPTEFWNQLDAMNDWAYIIGAHALCEAALNQIIMKKISLREDIVYFIVSRMPTQEKLSLTKKYALTSREERSFVTALSELRNDIVHDVRKVAFSLEDYFKILSSSKIELYMKLSLSDTSKGNIARLIPEIRQQPRNIIRFGVMNVVGSIG